MIELDGMILPTPHLNSDNPGKFIVVEGVMGIGKSTLCKSLTEVRGARAMCLQEPVDKPAFRELLGLYYKDPGRWGFTFQMYALKERLKQHTLAAELAANGIDIVQDRSIFTDSCFGSLVHADGNMTQAEWDIYADTFGVMKRQLRYPDALVYLRASPEICFERCNARARAEEAGVPLDYLKRLHEEHEKLAQSMARFTRVIIFDWSDFDNDVVEINTKINAVLAEDVRFLRDFARL